MPGSRHTQGTEPGRNRKGTRSALLPGIGQNDDLPGMINSLTVELVDDKTIFIVELTQTLLAPEDCVVEQSDLHERSKPLDS